jgi:dihydroorotase
MRIQITGGRLVDPSQGLDRVADLYIAAGRVVSIGHRPEGFEAQRTVEAHGRVVCPGLVDLCARLREPGQEHKATIASETRAAVRGGITTLCCPPDTDPVIDTPAVAELIHRRAQESSRARVVCLGALTRGLQGEALAEMHALKAIGCVGVSNGSRSVRDTEVLRRALEYAAACGLTVFLHPEDPWLGRGVMHEGPVSTRLGLPGVPETAETVALSRDLLLVEQTGARAHFCRLSTGRGVAMIVEALERGLPVSADVSAHQLHLTDVDVGRYDSRCHVRPPLRSRRDLEGLRAGLRSGAIQVICSDHQPHDQDAKSAPFEATEPGISGLETLLYLVLKLAQEGLLDLSHALALLTEHPARILGLSAGTLALGSLADVCVFDPEAEWTPGEEGLVSAGKSTPFLDWGFKGRVTHTLVHGQLVYGGDRETRGEG